MCYAGMKFNIFWIPSVHICLSLLLLHSNSIVLSAVLMPKYAFGLLQSSLSLPGHAAMSQQTPDTTPASQHAISVDRSRNQQKIIAPGMKIFLHFFFFVNVPAMCLLFILATTCYHSESQRWEEVELSYINDFFCFRSISNRKLLCKLKVVRVHFCHIFNDLPARLSQC